MPSRVSEAIVLRTFPLKEADLIVSFLSRDLGKLRGVARRARRPKSPFGAGLERLSYVRMSYYQVETRELVNLDSCELIRSPFGLLSEYRVGYALDFLAEVTEQLLPAAEVNERFFRLLLAVLEHLQVPAGQPAEAGRVWRAVTYFSLWAVRLAGMLPELHACLGCGTVLDDPEHPATAWFSRGRAGLVCGHCRRTLGGQNAWELGQDSQAIAAEMLQRHIGQLTAREWRQETAADLRRFLVQQMETHIERHLVTVPMLEEKEPDSGRDGNGG